MCMMKNSGEKEACEVARNLEAIGVRATVEGHRYEITVRRVD